MDPEKIPFNKMKIKPWRETVGLERWRSRGDERGHCGNRHDRRLM